MAATPTVESLTLWRCGDFAGDWKWNGCAALPDERLIFAPCDASSILLFDPKDGLFEEIGSFEGDCKWSGCLVLPDGRVVFAPFHATSVLLFNPADNSWEHVGHFEGFGKWSGCALLADGRVIFAPYGAKSILLFDPSNMTFEMVGDFEGGGKWSGCVSLPDNQVVFAPFCAKSILVFDVSHKTWDHVGDFEGGYKWQGCAVLRDKRVVFAPRDASSILLFDASDKSWEHVGNFDGENKWSGCDVLVDGRVVFAPWNAASIMLFSPSDKTWELVGHFDGDVKWTGCVALSSGLVVFVPNNAAEILVTEHTSQNVPALPQKRSDIVLDTALRMWAEPRAFTDAVVDAGERPASPSKKSIPVHRAVLASRSEVFAKMFAGPFQEAEAARVALPEDPVVVEAVLEHTYTGVLPTVDLLEALALADRLGLGDCVAACAGAADSCEAVDAIRVLAPRLGDPAIDAAWRRLKFRLCRDDGLLDEVLHGLLACRKAVDSANDSMDSVSTAVQTDDEETDGPQDASVGMLSQDDDGGFAGMDRFTDCSAIPPVTDSDCDGDNMEDNGCPWLSVQHGRVANHTLVASLSASEDETPLAPSNSILLHFNRVNPEFLDVLEKLETAQRLVATGVDIRPGWAGGATVLVGGLDEQALQQTGVDPSTLRPWNVIVDAEDAPSLRLAVQSSLPCRRRPREQTMKARRLTLKTLSRSDAESNSDLCLAEGHTTPVEAFDALPVPTGPAVDGKWHISCLAGLVPAATSTSESAPENDRGRDELDDFVGTGIAGLTTGNETAATVDEETAALIQHEQWATAVELRISRLLMNVDSGLACMPVKNTFLHYPDRPGDSTPRTVFTD